MNFEEAACRFSVNEKQKYSLRKAVDADAEQINRLYYAVSGRRRTPEQYAWEWDACPAGPSDRWVIVQDADQTVVGHHGLIPVDFNCHGETFRAGKTENTMVDPLHRGKFYYLFFEKKALAEAKSRYGLLFTTAGGGTPGKIRARLGYREVGTWVTHIFRMSPDYLLLKIKESLKEKIKLELPAFLLRFACRAYIGFQDRISGLKSRMRMEKQAAHEALLRELEIFWNQNKKHFGLTPERSAAYLKWRFFDNPYHDYGLYLFYDARVLQGYLIGKPVSMNVAGRIFSKFVVEDMIALENRADFYAHFIMAMKPVFKKHDLAGFRTVYFPNRFNAVLAKQRFNLFKRLQAQTGAQGSPFYAYPISDHGEDWFITESFSEGVL